MIKKVLLASVFALALNGAANAAAPANEKECQELVKNTFTMLAKKSLSKDNMTKAETMLDTLVKQCEKKAFSDAEKTATELKGMAG